MRSSLRYSAQRARDSVRLRRRRVRAGFAGLVITWLSRSPRADGAFTLVSVMGQDVAGTGAIIEIEEPSAAADGHAAHVVAEGNAPSTAVEGRLAHLRRELAIREREERAARREMGRLTEQLIRNSRAARTQLERARAEDAAELQRIRAESVAALAAARERTGVELEEASERAAAELAAALGGAQAELEAQTDELRALLAEREQSKLKLRRALDSAETELLTLRRQLESSERARVREASEHSTRSRQLEQTVSALSVGLRQTRDDIERAARSRAWRLGHFLTR